VSDGSGLLLPLAGAAAGGLLAASAREAVLASPALLGWVRRALEPLQRAGREGYSPSSPERRRLAVLGSVAAVAGGWFIGGVSLPGSWRREADVTGGGSSGRCPTSPSPSPTR
jgi:hypothetical protein